MHWEAVYELRAAYTLENRIYIETVYVQKNIIVFELV